MITDVRGPIFRSNPSFTLEGILSTKARRRRTVLPPLSKVAPEGFPNRQDFLRLNDHSVPRPPWRERFEAAVPRLTGRCFMTMHLAGIFMHDQRTSRRWINLLIREGAIVLVQKGSGGRGNIYRLGPAASGAAEKEVA